MSAPELAFAEKIQRFLQAVGTASLEYITAEFQPFSNQQRPDVVFVPRVGGYEGQTIFIEIKLSAKPIGSARGFQRLVEKKQFASEALGARIGRYLYVTNESVPELLKKRLEQEGIQVLDDIANEPELEAQLQELGLITSDRTP
jgi:hypothetical protein